MASLPGVETPGYSNSAPAGRGESGVPQTGGALRGGQPSGGDVPPSPWPAKGVVDGLGASLHPSMTPFDGGHDLRPPDPRQHLVRPVLPHRGDAGVGDLPRRIGHGFAAGGVAAVRGGEEGGQAERPRRPPVAPRRRGGGCSRRRRRPPRGARPRRRGRWPHRRGRGRGLEGRPACAGLEGERPLARRRQQHLGRERMGGEAGQGEAVEAGAGEDDAAGAASRATCAAGCRRCRGSARPAGPGRRIRIWARRRSAPVSTTAPSGRPSRSSASSLTSTSRGSARSGWAATASPSGRRPAGPSGCAPRGRASRRAGRSPAPG